MLPASVWSMAASCTPLMRGPQKRQSAHTCSMLICTRSCHWYHPGQQACTLPHVPDLLLGLLQLCQHAQAASQPACMQGLAYSIGGGWDMSPVDHPGVFVAEATTAYPAQLLDLLMSSLQAHPNPVRVQHATAAIHCVLQLPLVCPSAERAAPRSHPWLP